MKTSWSQAIAEKYALQLPPDVVSWLDDGAWREAGPGEFVRPLSPQELLELSPDAVWGGFLPPDFLPWIGNDYGDWICLRVHAENRIEEVVIWRHAGGDWIPCGTTLATAVKYLGQTPPAGSPRTAGEPPFQGAGPPRRDAPPDAPSVTQKWAQAHAGANGSADGRRQAAGPAASQRDQIVRSLHCPLRDLLDAQLANQHKWAWEPDAVSWQFDAELTPAAARSVLQQVSHRAWPELASQDWKTAEALARQVLASRNDLAWAFDVAGWAAERRGDLEAAQQIYRQGAACSAFTDETVSFRTNWTSPACGKFSIARLLQILTAREQQNLPDREQAYLQLFSIPDETEVRERVSQYWLEVAAAALASSDPAAAYRAYYRAGWDLGLIRTADYGQILGGLADAAQASNWSSLSRLAELHHRRLLSA